jgi:hypothetical protein
LFFSDMNGIVHREFVPPNTMVNSFIVLFWDAWEKMCNEKDHNFGATTTGSFIITTHPPTCPWKPQYLWLTTTWLSFPILLTLQT